MFYKLSNFRASLSCILLFVKDGIAINDTTSKVMLFYVHVCFLAFNRCRRGDKISVELVSHLLKKQVASSKFARWIYGRLKAEKDDFLLQ